MENKVQKKSDLSTKRPAKNVEELGLKTWKGEVITNLKEYIKNTMRKRRKDAEQTQRRRRDNTKRHRGDTQETQKIHRGNIEKTS